MISKGVWRLLNNRNIFSVSGIFLLFLAFIIVWEWLRPLPIITEIRDINVFIWFTLFSFVIIYIGLARFIAIPLSFIVIMFSLHHVFFEGSFFRDGFSTLVWLGEDFARNISLLMNNDIHLLSYEFRTFLLFLVLAITSYLIHYWVFHLKKIFLFLLGTVVYVTVIDTFTGYDASNAIVRIVVAGFLLMTILYKLRLEEKEEVERDDYQGKAWTNMLIGIIAIVSMIAFIAPKYDPHWPDPVPMIKGATTGEGTTVQTIGYSQNDERLGGGFIDDERVVFTAISKQSHYWRGESKEIYTGHGWVSIEPELNRTFRYSDFYDEKVAVQLFERSVPKEKSEVTISMVDDHRFWHFFYPGELVEVNEGEIEFYSESSGNPFRFLIDYVSGKVGTTVADDGNAMFLKEYTLTYNSPEFVINDLMNSSENDPEHIKEVYLQLPELPERVGQLAQEITAEFNNRYDKVKAVEGYFSKNDFQYETTDVPRPEEGQDYVDQFLFETRRGYCDNFSTAMIVMLRTLDIPARWVKGFTQGEMVERLADGYRLYEISNNNAHSWVEVYFPGIGWVPFEPTRGFTHTYDFVEEQIETETPEIERDTERDEIPEIVERENDPENPFLPYEENNEWNTEVGSMPGSGQSGKEFKFPAKTFWTIIAVVLTGLVIRKNHKKLITLFFLYNYKLKSSNRNIFMKAYQRLLWLLSLNGYGRKEGETLREYAYRIDRQLSCDELKRLTLHYEKLYYGNGSEDKIWQEARRDWEVLVKKMSS